MKICVRLFATLTQLVPETVSSRYPQGIRAGSPLEVELPEGSTLADLVGYLALPGEKVRVAFVNGRAKKLDYRLVPGDEVGIFPPVGGG
jgi:molybdopterin synthase sulfur carrier subunit